MGYRTHAALTIFATLAGVIAGSGMGLFAGVQFLKRDMLWPLPLFCVIGGIAGFYFPTWLMQAIPVRCAKCGGTARFRRIAWKFKNAFVPSPVYAYRCDRCKWSTYRRTS